MRSTQVSLRDRYGPHANPGVTHPAADPAAESDYDRPVPYTLTPKAEALFTAGTQAAAEPGPHELQAEQETELEAR